MRPGEPPDVADVAALLVQAKAHITAWLDRDDFTMSRVMMSVRESGAAPEQVAEAYALAAASLLTDAFGGRRSRAAVLAAFRLEEAATRQARAVAGLV